MKTYAYITVLVCTLFMCIGQIFLKLSANMLHSGATYLDKQVYIPFAAAGAIYALATIAWVWALQYVPLSRAFPFVAISYIVVPAAGWLYFEEQLGPTYGLGSFLIVVGVFLTNRT